MRDIQLFALFNPRSILVIGTFADMMTETKNSHLDQLIVSNLQNWDYQGRIVPVKWTAPGFPDQEIPDDDYDLAIICLPPTMVLQALDWSADQGVHSVIVTSSGFREIGGQGYYLEEQIVHLATSRHITLLGPNCLGVASWPGSMNASLIAPLPTQGNIAFFSPSGSMCHAVLGWAASENIGFSKFASLGNRAVIDEASMLQFLAQDPDTAVIIGYLEGMNSGRRFARISQTITREKPVIMLPGGMTQFGRQAISSHIGALTGSEQAYQTALRQAGIILVDNLTALFDLARIFGTQPLPQGPNLVILTNSGGAGILAADSLLGTSLNLPRLHPDLVQSLENILPPHAQITNPIDMGMAATPSHYALALGQIIQDPQVDMVLVVVTPGMHIQIMDVVHELALVPKRQESVIAVCLIGQEAMLDERRFLQKHDLPCYTNPKSALTSLDALFAYAQWQARPYPVEVCYRRDKAKADAFLTQCLQKGRLDLFGLEVLPLLQAYELLFPQTELARTSRSAVKIAKRMACPVALKIASPFIAYKRDVDGVELNLTSADEVRRAFLSLTSRAQCLRSEAFISGCLVQAMVPEPGLEFCIRVQRDPRFGPLVHFGFAHEMPENLQNFALRLAPLSLDDTASMLREVKVFSQGKGKRGREGLDFQALEDVLLTASQICLDFTEIHALEFDPVLVTSQGAWVVGVRLTLLPSD